MNFFEEMLLRKNLGPGADVPPQFGAEVPVDLAPVPAPVAPPVADADFGAEVPVDLAPPPVAAGPDTGLDALFSALVGEVTELGAATVDNVVGFGQAAGRGAERGLLRSRASLPQAQAGFISSRVGDAVALENDALLADVIRDIIQQDVPEGLDLSSPEAATSQLLNMGFGPMGVGRLADIYGSRVEMAGMTEQGGRDAALDQGVGYLQDAAGLLGRASAIPRSAPGERFAQEFAKSPDTWSGAVGPFIEDPLGGAAFLGDTAAESIPQIAASAAATLAGGPAAGAAVMGAGTLAQEYGVSVAEFMDEKGVVLKTPEDARALLENADLMGEASRRGIGRAVVISAMEMLGQGVAARTLMKSATGNALAQTGVQAATGAGGEVAARAATGQEQSIKEALVEGLAEGVTAPVEVGPAMIADATKSPAKDFAKALNASEPQGPTARAFRGGDTPGITPDAPAPAPNSEVPVDLAPPAPATAASEEPEPGSEVPPDLAPAPEAEAEADPVEIALPDDDADLDADTDLDVDPDPQADLDGQPIAPPDTDVDMAAQVEPPTEQVAPPPAQAEPVASAESNPADLPLAPAPEPMSEEEASAAVDASMASYEQARQDFQTGVIDKETYIAARQKHDAAIRAWDEARARKDARLAAEPPAPVAPVAPRTTEGRAAATPAGELRPGDMTPDFAEATRPPVPGKGDNPRAITDGNFTVVGRWALRNDALPSGTLGGIKLETVGQGSAPTQDTMDRIMAQFPKTRDEGQKISWRVAVSREGTADADRVVGLLPDGKTVVAVDGDFYGFTVNRNGWTLAASRDGKTVGVYNQKGELIGGTQPVRTGAEEDLTYLNSQPEFETTKPVQRGPQNPPAPKRPADAPAPPRLNRKAIEAQRDESLRALDEVKAEIARRMQAGDTDPVSVTLTTPSGKRTKFSFPPTERGAENVEKTKANWKSRPAATLADAGASPVRTPKGGFTPGMEDVSFTKGVSKYQQAWRDAGLDPDVATLKTPREQINILTRLMENTFGMKTERNPTNPGKANDVVDNLLDAYQNLRGMMNVLGLPLQALGLNNTLTLSLEGFKGRYLGMFDPNANRIHMPGRSNSFAHEWGHALDFFLHGTLTPQKEGYLLTKVARNEGLDPNESIQEAFVHLIHRMFFDKADLALKMLKLEAKAQAVDAQGNPTKAAQTAIRQLGELKTGNTRLKIMPSAYRLDSANYSPPAAGYYASVHEMFARAFEAYVGFKMEQAGGPTTNGFVTKGDAAYLSDADARLAMTFPKAHERMAIFDAFDNVFHHLRTSAILGTDPAAAMPDGADIMDPRHWAKAGLAADLARDSSFMAGLKREITALKNSVTGIPLSPRTMLKSTTAYYAGATGMTDRTGLDVARGVWDTIRRIFNSVRGTAKLAIAGAPKDAQIFMRFLMDGVMTDPGTGREQQFTVEEKAERTTLSVTAEIEDAMKDTGQNQNILTGGLTDAKRKNVRALLYGGDAAVPNATSGEVKFAAALRNIMLKAYRRATDAGLEMGYVEDQGYLPRIIDRVAVNLAPDTFRERAARLYEIHFNNETDKMDAADLLKLARLVADRVDPSKSPGGPLKAEISAHRKAVQAYNRAVRALDAAREQAKQNPSDPKLQAAVVKARQDVKDTKQAVDTTRQELLDATRPFYGTTSAENWLRRIQTGGGISFDTMAPDADFKAKRSLPKEAEEIMGDLYVSDPIDLVVNYVHDTAKRAAYQEHYGVENKANDKLDAILGREAVKDAIRAKPAKYNTKTPAGRLAILRDLANPATDNIKEMAIEEARKAGANPDHLQTLRSNVATIMGTNGAEVSRHTAVAVGAVYVWGTITLLPRAAITSLSEPAAFYAKTGDFKNTARMFGLYMKEAVRGAQSTKELAAMARAVGLVASPLHDILMMNRVSDGGDGRGVGSVVLSRFFRANMLAQLTNAQRRAGFKASFFLMKDMAHRLKEPATTPKQKGWQQVIRGDFRDAGVPDAQIDAFADWLTKQDTFPDLDSLNTPQGALFGMAGARFVDQLIQNPRRADKAVAAMHPVGRLIWGLTSFIYAFTRNVITANILRTKRVSEEMRAAGVGTAKARALATGNALNSLGIGFAAIYVGQLIVGAFRAYIFDNAQWEKHGPEGDDDRFAWLAALALSRSGAVGPSDVVLQAITGLRYERDLTSLTAGPALGMLMSGMQNLLNGLPNMKIGPWEVAGRNSPRNDNAEHTAVKSFYRMAIAPAISAGLSLAPASSMTAAVARTGGLMLGSSNTMADSFADLFFEKTSRGTN